MGAKSGIVRGDNADKMRRDAANVAMSAEAFVIVAIDAEGKVGGISLIPQRYPEGRLAKLCKALGRTAVDVHEHFKKLTGTRLILPSWNN